MTRPAPPAEHVSRTPPGQYQPAVKAALDAVRAGEVFQVQVGQRFEVETDADALDVYRVLRTLNPSPYMYLLRLDGFDIVGSSPEALVTVTERRGPCCTRSPGPGRGARRPSGTRRWRPSWSATSRSGPST